MDLELNHILLVMCRITPLFSGVGISPFSRIPKMIRFVMILVFTIAVNQLIEFPVAANRPLVFAIISELFFGLLFLLVLQGAFAALLFWGRVVDMQIGFGAAAVLNPATHSQDSLIGTIISTAAITFMFLTGVHHLLLEFLINSYRLFPLGAQHIYITPQQIAMFFGTEFSIAMLLFAPVMIVIWTLDVMVGLISKTMPQMNIYFVTLPLKITVGITVLAVMVNYARPLLDNLFGQILLTLDRLG